MAAENAVAGSACAITLLSRHILETKALIETAVEGVCQSFEDTARLSQLNLERTTHFLGQSDAAHAGADETNLEVLIARSEQVLHHLLERLSDVCDKSRSATQRLNLIDERIGRVSHTLTQIDDITAANRILAVNARIQAAHLGTQGTGFGVVADEITSQAKLSVAFSNSIAQLIDQLREAVALSRQDLLAAASHDRDAMENSKQEVVRTHADFRSFLDRTQRFLTEAADDGRKLTADIHRSVRGLQFQDRASQRLEYIANELDLLNGQFAGDVQFEPKVISAHPIVRDMMTRTSMHDQREPASRIAAVEINSEVELF